MREYRGKRIDNGQWSCGDLIRLLGEQGKGRMFIVDNRFGACIDSDGSFVNTEAPFVNEVDPSTVGQRIGVSDWFDGDLIEITYDTSFIDKEKSVHCIKYRAEEDYPAYDLEPWIDCGMNALSWLMSNSDPSVLSYKVIGNIHDNPELLNAE